MEHRWLEHYEPEVPRDLEGVEGTLNGMFEKTVADHPDLPATIFFGRRFSWREIGELTARLAATLHGLGIGKGDRVAIILPNLPQYLAAHFAILRLGAIVVPNNPLYTDKELAFQLKDAGARVAIALNLLVPRLERIWDQTDLEHCIVCKVNDYLPGVLKLLYPVKARLQGHKTRVPDNGRYSMFTDRMAAAEGAGVPAVAVHDTDLAMLLYTGGTTGRSKGAMLTHRNLYVNVVQVAFWLTDLKHGGEVIMAALPFFHSYGLTTCLHLSAYCASPTVLIPKFDVKQVLKSISEYKASIFPGVPTMYVAINTFPKVERFDLTSVRACISGAAPLPLEVQKTFEELTGGRLVEGYGLSEASPVCLATPVYGKRKIGFVGIPVPGTVAQVVDPEDKKPLGVGEVGEMAIKGPQVMQGYWNMPEETKGQLDSGWLFTGDMTRMDEEGFFAIVDRKKDMIISGGYNIYPREVEEVLYEHPAVQECGVIAIPDAYKGEKVKAYVVLKEGVQATEEELIEFCKKGLANYKVPAAIAFAQELPKSLIGKILRKEIRSMEEEGATRPLAK
jgi:long-chain acyl-CoA synthetase